MFQLILLLIFKITGWDSGWFLLDFIISYNFQTANNWEKNADYFNEYIYGLKSEEL